MQLQSSLARLAAFAFFLLSFSMLVCAAPAPGAGSLAVRDSSLVARTTPTEQCNAVLVKLQADLKIDLKTLVTCSKTAACDVKPILAGIVAKLDAAIKAIIAIGVGIDITIVVKLWIQICIDILIALKACISLSITLCADLAVKLCAYIKLLLDLCIDLTLKLSVKAQAAAAIKVYLDVCLKLGFNALLVLVGLL
ncbi:hypothetical protein FRC12_004839 [Ceratobasidium sp. 428]|nr:hypothetical protein FRC12_004839 [Ceratobasidium sp. 428]